MEYKDQFDNPYDPFGRIYHKIDNVYMMNKNYLTSINIGIWVIVILEVSKFLH
jgi:hypothetical protein